MSSYFRGVLAALIVASAAATASAQQAAPAAPAPTYSAKWNNGLSLESSDGDNKFQVGTLIQADGRFVTDDPPAIANTFLLRRARIILQGRVQKYFEFYLLPDFAGSAITLFDAYIDTKFSSAFRIRTGKSKAPLGLETLYSDANIPFAERSVANNLAPNRDVGRGRHGRLVQGPLQLRRRRQERRARCGQRRHGHQRRQGSRRSRHRPLRPRRRSGRRDPRQAERRAPQLQEHGAADVLLLRDRRHGQRRTQPRVAVGLRVLQVVRRLRRILSGRRRPSRRARRPAMSATPGGR